MGKKAKLRKQSQDNLNEQLQELANYISKLEEQNERCTALLEQQQAALTQIFSLSGEQMIMLRKQAMVISHFLALLDTEIDLHKNSNVTVEKN